MSDDRNTDDFSWLRGDDEPQDDSPDDDGGLFGWEESDEEDQPRPPDDRLGFTGDLAWRGGESSEDAPPGDSAGFGLTGQLPWMRRYTDDEPGAGDAGGDDLDWLRGTEDDLLAGRAEPPSAEPEPEPGESGAARPHISLPDWLDDADTDEPAFDSADAEAVPYEPRPSWEPSVEADPADTGLPDWLLDDEELASAEPPPPAEPPDEVYEPFGTPAPQPADTGLPDWLLDDEEPALAEPPPPAEMSFVDDTGRLSEEWLKTGELLPETADSDLTFDEWFAQQAEAERVPDIEEHLPEFGPETIEPHELDTGEVGTGDLPAWFLGLDEMDTSAAPDWFTGEAPLPAEPAALEPPAPAEPATLGGFDESFFDTDAQAEPALEDFDLDALFGPSEPAEAADWFTEQSAPPEPGWLEDLGSLENLDFEAAPAEAGADLPEPDLAELGLLDEPQAAAPVSGDDIDSLLASYDSGDVVIPAADVDFDALLEEPDLEAFTGFEPEEQPPLAPDAPDWLTEVGASVGGVSAAALMRQRQDRPLAELPDRLQKLRTRGEEVLAQQPPADPGALAELLPGVEEVLPPAPAATAASELAAGLLLTPDQRGRVELLRALAGSAETADMGLEPAPSAETGFLADEDDFPFDAEYEETPAQAADEALVPSARRRARLKPARLLIALLVGAAVILPFFVPALRVGDLPPAEFAAGSDGRAVFETLDDLRPGDLVLVGVEYGPTAAGELDDLTNVLLRHILLRRAHPVVVGTNAVGVLRADLILRDLGGADSPFLADIGRGTPLRPNDDYYVIRYLPAAGVGLRALGLNAAALLSSDVRGQPTGLGGTELADFAAVVLVGERPEDLRAWAEQIAPLTSAPLLAASGFSAAPLLEPYAGPAFIGLLVGFPDAFTYAAMLAAPGVRQAVPEVIEEPETSAPDFTEEPADTPTAEPTATPTPVLPTAVIFSTQSVNVRQGPGADFAVVTAVEPNTEVVVLAQSDGALWTQIRLPGGIEGWVSSSLLRLRPVEGAVPTATTPPTNTAAPSATSLPPTGTVGPTATLPPTDTPAPTSTNTPAPSATVQASATPIPPTATPEPPQVTAVVIASQGVNVRSGPGTSFQPIGSLAPGTEVVVIGRSGDAGWIQVRLDDGREGWVSAPLLQINAPEGSSSAPNELIVVMAGESISGLLRQEAPPAPAPAISYAEERWFGMNLGLLVIVLIILLGAVLNTVRSIVRRRR